MSIASNEEVESSRNAPLPEAVPEEPGEISDRKAHHLEICVDEERYSVETGNAGFSAIRFLHRSLPEVDERRLDTRMRFLGHEVALPLLISCMTGGSAEGTHINRRLAEAAQRARIPVGTGSVRILFRDESYFDQFHMKPLAPDVPVIANLSAVQVRDIDHRRIAEVLRRLEVQALAIHLNAGQELFQPNGDRDFRGLKEAIEQFCGQSPVPVIVKETGFGIRPSEIDFLLSVGVAYIDLAGAGGTNWARVESYRVSDATARVARELDHWGIPTAVLLTALRSRTPPASRHAGPGKPSLEGAPAPTGEPVPERESARTGVPAASGESAPAGQLASTEGRIIASGGLRSGLEVAKSLVMGAELAGVALPFARAVHSGGVDAVLEEIAAIEKGLRSVMTLTGSPDLAALRSQHPLIEPCLTAEAASLLAADDDPADRRNE